MLSQSENTDNTENMADEALKTITEKPSTDDLRAFALPYADPAPDPGKTLGRIAMIIGIVVFVLFVLNAFVLHLSIFLLIPASVAGVIVSCIAMAISKKARYKNSAATIGFYSSIAPYIFSVMIPLYRFLFQAIRYGIFLLFG